MVSDLSVSFVMPMYNERDNIERSIGLIRSLADDISGEYEIVVVDDGSTDGCSQIVESMAKDDPRIRPFRLERNSKFGGAFARGIKEARKDVIVYMDSDIPVSERDIKESFSLINGSDIVNGYSRVKKGETARRKFISGVYNLMVRTLFGLDVKDINSGYKIMRREAFQDLDFISRSPFVDVELFLHAKRNGRKVGQFPLVFNPREGGQSYIARPHVIWATFCDMIRVRLDSFFRGR